MTYNLFLDDERQPPSDGQTWVVVRSYNEAVCTVRRLGFPQFVSFDHDLGVGQSGYDFAKYLVERDYWNHDMPKNFAYYVHSQNPVGKQNISVTLDRYLEQQTKSA